MTAPAPGEVVAFLEWLDELGNLPDFRGKLNPYEVVRRGREALAAARVADVLPAAARPGFADWPWVRASSVAPVGGQAEPSDAMIEAGARAIAEVNDSGHSFDQLDAWTAMEDWQREAYPDEAPDDEDLAWHRKLADASIRAAAAVSGEQA